MSSVQINSVESRKDKGKTNVSKALTWFVCVHLQIYSKSFSFHLHVVWFLGHCSCMHLQSQRHSLAVVEAAAFTLSQLLQAEDAAEKIIPLVLSFFPPTFPLTLNNKRSVPLWSLPALKITVSWTFVHRMVLASSLPSHLLSVLTPDPQFGLAPAIECAWCLHYLSCRWEPKCNFLWKQPVNRSMWLKLLQPWSPPKAHRTTQCCWLARHCSGAPLCWCH